MTSLAFDLIDNLFSVGFLRFSFFVPLSEESDDEVRKYVEEEKRSILFT